MPYSPSYDHSLPYYANQGGSPASLDDIPSPLLLTPSKPPSALPEELDDTDFDFSLLPSYTEAHESQADWDGPARPGSWYNWVSKNHKLERGDGWWDPLKGEVGAGDVPGNVAPGEWKQARVQWALRKACPYPNEVGANGRRFKLNVPGAS